MTDCPYYDRNYKQCAFFGTSQDESQRNSYCLTSDNWKRCANYDRRSYDEKVQKKLRPNPDL
jgi:hypothetical protein